MTASIRTCSQGHMYAAGFDACPECGGAGVVTVAKIERKSNSKIQKRRKSAKTASKGTKTPKLSKNAAKQSYSAKLDAFKNDADIVAAIYDGRLVEALKAWNLGNTEKYQDVVQQMIDKGYDIHPTYLNRYVCYKHAA